MITEETKLHLESFLPDAVAQILSSCAHMLDANEKFADTKEFMEFHKSFKVAVTNIESLFKLYQWTKGAEVEGLDIENIRRKVAKAEARIIKSLNKINDSEIINL